MTKSKMGRPPKPKAEVKTELVGLRFTKAELAQLKREARSHELTLGEYIRSRLGLRKEKRQ
jgi:hypothetical protein